MKTTQKYMPALVVCLLLGVLTAGVWIGSRYAVRRVVINYDTDNKIDELMALVHSNYVDTVDFAQMVEEAMPKILGGLDPHSIYIPAEELEASNADLRGSFSGIGVQFTIHDDTIHINNVISGGPSQRTGLMAGDRIVTIDDSLYVGKKVSSNGAMKLLKGPKGTQVELGVVRRGVDEMLHFTIERGDIPVKSVDAAYLIDDKYGYINLNKFGETTFAEMMVAIARFRRQQFAGLILDLRGNLGGYMETAIQIANQFLRQDEMIVYREGEHEPRIEDHADGTGICQNIPLVVLIDEQSASSSEILAGTIQDNDRGTIVGRRSFGKGLVQQVFDFSDGSAMRLTVARYYTPSGRCIQKPYVKGESDAYEMDIVNRYEHGEFFSQDSIRQNDSLAYKTALGRTVYGGGGIMPDVFVPSDTAGITSYYTSLSRAGLFNRFSFRYADEHRRELKKYREMATLLDYLKTQPLVDELVSFAAQNGVKPRYNLIAKSRRLITRTLYSFIIYDLLDMEEHLKFLNMDDPAVLRAVEILHRGEAFPRAPQEPADSARCNSDKLCHGTICRYCGAVLYDKIS